MESGMHSEGMAVIENEKSYTSREVLHMMRHDAKEKDPSKTDTTIRLTPEGRMHAHELASSETNINQSVAFGSPRDRAQETAGHIMAGGQEDITGQETLEELKAKLDQEFSEGGASKIGVDPRLNFILDKGQPYADEVYKYFDAGQYLEYVVNQSDQRAVELGDETNFTYSRSAKAVAEVVLKYLHIAPRWDKLANDPSKGYSDTLERFLGSHQGVFESFLAKVVEKTKGVEERDRFVIAVDKQGFGFSEGLEVEILSHGSEQITLHLTYRKENQENPEKSFEFDEDIPVGLMQEIVQG